MQLRTSLFVGSKITTLSLQLDLEVDPCLSPLLPGCRDERVKKLSFSLQVVGCSDAWGPGMEEVGFLENWGLGGDTPPPGFPTW